MKDDRSDLLKVGLTLMLVVGIIILVLLFLTGCAPKKTLGIDLIRIHDDEVNVTCWKSSTGLFCFPDYMLEKLPPEADTARTIRPTDLYNCTQIGCESTRLKPDVFVTVIERYSCTWLWVEAEGETGYVRVEDVEGAVPDFDGCPSDKPFQQPEMPQVIG